MKEAISLSPGQGRERNVPLAFTKAGQDVLIPEGIKLVASSVHHATEGR